MSEMPNRVHFSFTEEQLKDVLEAIRKVDTALPLANALTSSERQSLVKMGQAQVGFINQALALVETEDSFLPRSFDLDAMKLDVTLTNQLLEIKTNLSALLTKFDDNYLVASSEAYKAALVVYQSAKQYGSEAIQPTVKEMAKVFKGGSSAATEGETAEDQAQESGE